MKYRMTTALCILLCMPAIATSASFDCNKASTAIEKRICSHDLLGAYDLFLAKQYQETSAVLQAYPKENLQKSQRLWLKERNKHCTETKSCIAFYAQRITELKHLYEDSGVDVYQVTTPRTPTRLTHIDLGDYIAHVTWVYDVTHSITLIKKDGHRIIQTISLVGDSDNLSYGYDHSLEGSFLTMVDDDKDGHKDLRLGIGSGSGGHSYEIWRYNSQTGLFDHHGHDIQGTFKGTNQ